MLRFVPSRWRLGGAVRRCQRALRCPRKKDRQQDALELKSTRKLIRAPTPLRNECVVGLFISPKMGCADLSGSFFIPKEKSTTCKILLQLATRYPNKEKFVNTLKQREYIFPLINYIDLIKLIYRKYTYLPCAHLVQNVRIDPGIKNDAECRM